MSEDKPQENTTPLGEDDSEAAKMLRAIAKELWDINQSLRLIYKTLMQISAKIK